MSCSPTNHVTYHDGVVFFVPYEGEILPAAIFSAEHFLQWKDIS